MHTEVTTSDLRMLYFIHIMKRGIEEKRTINQKNVMYI